MRKTICIALALTFSLGCLCIGGCATGDRQRNPSEQQQQSQYIPPRPYTAA